MILRALLALWTSVARPMGDHLWQSTLFLAVAAILALALRKNQARLRYWVWLTASVKFLIPFSLLIALGSHLARPRVNTPAQVIVYSAVEDFSQPFAGQQMPAIYHSTPTVAPVSLLHVLPAMVVAVWFVGIIGVLLRWVVGWVRISLMVRKAAFIGEGPEVDALRRLESSLGVRKPIRLVLSPDWMEPGIFGIFRPVLIWPEGISEHLDNRHIEAILAHEVCHARCHDNLTAVLHMVVEAIFWFHPLVWWVGARLEEERERACDEGVSLLCNQPHVYAESILRVCKFCSESPLACVAGITGADLKKRIVQIMTERVARKLDLGRKLLLLAVGLAVVAVPIVLGQAQAAKRMMLAALRSVPEPFSAAAHAMIAEEQTPATALIAEAPGAAPATDERVLGPAFEVASIRPSAPDPVMMRWQPTNDGLIVNAQSLKTLITYAYGVLPEYVLGGPDWESSQLFDINAKYGEKETDALAKLPPKERGEQTKAILRTLLAERFKLKVRRETKDAPIYELTVAKGGPKLTASAPLVSGPDGRMPPEAGGTTWYPDGRHVMKRTSMLMFASTLSRDPDVAREVVDSTGLKGPYDLEYTWKQSQDGSGPSLFTALQEQLGLKLVGSKGPVETLVIESAEKPSVDGAEVPTQASVVPAPTAQQNGAAAGSITTDATAAMPSFEVASIRMVDAHTADELHRGVGLFSMSAYPTTHFFLHNAPLDFLIGVAYGIDEAYIQKDAGWMDSQLYDIDARVGGNKPLTQEEMRPLLQNLLAQRFHFTAHRTSRVVSGFELVTAKGGPKLKPARDGEETHAQILPNRLDAQSTSTKMLASILMRPAGQTVVDKTGLTGSYDVRLDYAAPNDTNSNLPSLFTAIEEQLGLRLQPAKVPVDFLVIDHADRVPTEN